MTESEKYYERQNRHRDLAAKIVGGVFLLHVLLFAGACVTFIALG